MVPEIIGERIYIVRTLAGETLIAEADAICLGECKLRWPMRYSEQLQQADHPEDAAKPQSDRRKVTRARPQMLPLSLFMAVPEYPSMVSSFMRITSQPIIDEYKSAVDQMRAADSGLVRAYKVPLEGQARV